MTIGGGGWEYYKFLFFDNRPTNSQSLYAVDQNGVFCKGTPPIGPEDNWAARAVAIGGGGWANFIFLFIATDFMSYAVLPNGNFFMGSLPLDNKDNWGDRAKPIGTSEKWNVFKFLFVN